MYVVSAYMLHTWYKNVLLIGAGDLFEPQEQIMWLFVAVFCGKTNPFLFSEIVFIELYKFP